MYMSRVSEEYGRAFWARVEDWLISTPSADARDRFRSRREHSSSQVNGVNAGSRCGCCTCPLEATALAALQRRSWRSRPQPHVTVTVAEQGVFSGQAKGAWQASVHG